MLPPRRGSRVTSLCPPAVRNRARRGPQTSRPGSVLTSPAARRPPCRPGPEGRRSRARLPPPVWRRPGCSGAAGGGRLPAGLRNCNSCGRTRAGSQASEAELGPLGSWKAPKFPQRVTQPFFLSPGRSPRCQSTARGCGPPVNRAWRLPLPPVPRPRFSGAPPPPQHASTPPTPHPKWANESEAPYF